MDYFCSGCSGAVIDPRIFAATRTIAVAPWSEEAAFWTFSRVLLCWEILSTWKDVTPKPIFAISDGPGVVANLVARPRCALLNAARLIVYDQSGWALDSSVSHLQEANSKWFK